MSLFPRLKPDVSKYPKKTLQEIALEVLAREEKKNEQVKRRRKLQRDAGYVSVQVDVPARDRTVVQKFAKDLRLKFEMECNTRQPDGGTPESVTNDEVIAEIIDESDVPLENSEAESHVTLGRSEPGGQQIGKERVNALRGLPLALVAERLEYHDDFSADKNAIDLCSRVRRNGYADAISWLDTNFPED